MAASLNVPTDFTIKKIDGNPNVSLMTPSMFESKKSVDPWKDLAQAASEIKQLKSENEQLREKKQAALSTVEEFRARVDIPQAYFQEKEGHRYVDELIKRQATEICELKDQSRLRKKEYQEELTKFEGQLGVKERIHSQLVTSLESQLQDNERKYEKQVDLLCREHERETAELSFKLARLSEDFSDARQASSSKIDDLSSQLLTLDEKSKQIIKQLEVKLESNDSVIERQEKQIMHLRVYIGENEKVPKSDEIWRRERDGLKNQLKITISDHDNLQSTVQLMKIRLASTNEILNLHESELSRAKSDTIDKNKMESLLITRWREKVFALMVQQKSSGILLKKDEQNWKEKIGGLENMVTSCKNQLEVLTHALSDKNAELEMEKNTTKKLEEELYQAQNLALNLDDRLAMNLQEMETLRMFAESMWNKYQSVNADWKNSLATLQAYGQRICFASSRVDMLKGQIARKEVLLKLNRKEGISHHPETEDVEVLQDETDSDVQHVVTELERVTRERDMLAGQLQEDSQLLEQKLTSAGELYEDEIAQLKGNVKELQTALKDKSELEQEQQGRQESNENLEQLKMELGRQQIMLEKALEDQHTSDQSQFSEQLAEMDRNLNDSRREHTKAVVQLRQLERQGRRDRERSAEHLKTTEDHYLKSLEMVQQQLQDMERERNLMMATLRQEGLLSKVKAQRSDPIMLNFDDVSDEEQTGQKHLHCTTTTNYRPELQTDTGGEPLASVLDDIKSLTAIADSSDNSSTESDE